MKRRVVIVCLYLITMTGAGALGLCSLKEKNIEGPRPENTGSCVNCNGALSVGAVRGTPSVVVRTAHYGLWKCRLGAAGVQVRHGFGCMRLTL